MRSVAWNVSTSDLCLLCTNHNSKDTYVDYLILRTNTFILFVDEKLFKNAEFHFCSSPCVWIEKDIRKSCSELASQATYNKVYHDASILKQSTMTRKKRAELLGLCSTCMVSHLGDINSCLSSTWECVLKETKSILMNRTRLSQTPFYSETETTHPNARRNNRK